MKTIRPLYFAAVLSCVVATSACQKESTDIKPVMAAAPALDGLKATTTGTVTYDNAKPVNHPVFSEVGDVYAHYPILTGASNSEYVVMMLVSKNATPVSTIEKWESASWSNDTQTWNIGTVVSASARPLDTFGQPVVLPYTYTGETTVMVDNKPVRITAKTTWNDDGSVSMQAKDIFKDYL